MTKPYTLITELVNEYDSTLDWKINARLKRCLGRTMWKNNLSAVTEIKVEFSQRLLDYANEALIELVVKHELAHVECLKQYGAYLGSQHNDTFGVVCKSMGANPAPSLNVAKILEEDA